MMTENDPIKTETETGTEPCPRCEMNNKVIGMAVAHVACEGIADDESRGKCMEWATGLDPSTMTAEEMMEGAYDRAGIDGLSVFPEMHNKLIRKVLIKKVGEKLERGLPITEEEQQLYKQYIKKEAAEGI